MPRPSNCYFMKGEFPHRVLLKLSLLTEEYEYYISILNYMVNGRLLEMG